MVALKQGEDYALTPPKPPKPPKAGDYDARLRAYQLWKQTQNAEGTIVETYLQNRGYFGIIPKDLRFHPSLYHTSSKAFFPAMVAKVTRSHDNMLLGIHRTYLAKDGTDKAAITPNKMMLGNVTGGAVQFSEIKGESLIITEGIETALSVMLASDVRETIWACLSASLMDSLLLPPLDKVNQITIAADNDGAGLKAAYECAEQWQRKGRIDKIALPPKGQDFNDMLIEGAL